MIDEQTMGVILTLMAAFSWGIAAVINKMVIKPEHSLLLTMTIRGTIAVPFIAIVTLIINGFKSLGALFYPDIFPILLISSFFVGMGDLCLFGSLQRMDVSKTQPIAGMYPLFTAFFLMFFGIEDVTLDVIIATTILVIGIGLLSQQNEKSNSESTDTNSEKDFKMGFLIAIMAAIFWSLGINTLKVILDHEEIDVYSLATIRFAILTLYFVALWGIYSYHNHQTGREDPLSVSMMDKKTISVLGIGGILSWGIGAIFFFTAIEMIGAARATPISSINPLISVIIGVLLLKEKVTPTQAIGILLTVVGSMIISIQLV